MRMARLAARQRYNVVHVNNPPDFLVLAAAVPELLGAKVILDVHDVSLDMFAMRFGSLRGARLSDRILRLVKRTATRFADFVLTVHEPCRRELAPRGVSLGKVTVVMNSVDEPSAASRLAARRGMASTSCSYGTMTCRPAPPLALDAQHSPI
jgi:hypothetical protein